MNLSDYKEEKPHHFKRLFWYVINATIFRLMIGRATKQLRHSLLKLFGAEINKDAYIYSSATIFAPWNLKVGRVCIGPNTIFYNKDLIVIGDDSVISQGTYLCTASHDISSKMLPLNTAPIIIGKNVPPFHPHCKCFLKPVVSLNIEDSEVLKKYGFMVNDNEE